MKRTIAILMIIALIIPIIPNISYAGITEEARSEALSRPNKVEESKETDKPDTSKNDPVNEDPYKKSGTNIIPIEYGISGNIWEDFGNLDKDIGTYTRNNQLDENEKGTLNQNNIRLEIRKRGSDEVYATPKIDKDGSYSFEATEEGEYYVRLYYGKLDNNNQTYQDSNKVKSVLKYNGQDYICSKAGNAGEIDVDYRYEIIESGKGCTQIYLAMDCSKSMVENKHEGISRLEAQIKSAKKLIEELIDKNENNIYIGIVAFGEYAYKMQGLTKSKEKLNAKLDQILIEAKEKNYFIGSTDIRSVLYGIRNNQTKQYTENGSIFKNEEYFVNTDKENSNRYIFLLSDGIPLSDGNTVIYKEDSNDTVYKKVEEIIKNTREEIKAVLDDGIKETILITKTGDEEVDRYVEKMCKNVENLNVYLASTDVATKIIADKVKENIFKTSISEGTATETRYLIAGKENAQRRNEINEYYNKTYQYEDSIKFKVIDDYDPNEEEDRKAAQEISNTAYCYADTGTYHLYPKGKEWEGNTETGRNPDGSTYTIKNIYKAEKIIAGVDLVLTARENFMIEPIIKVTGVKIILADGRILTYNLSESAKFTDNQLQQGEIKIVENITEPIVYYIDTEIMHNSRIDIEYTIIVKNTSLIKASDVEIIYYAPEGFYIDSEQNMLTVNYNNKDYGWDITNVGELMNDKLVAPELSKQDCARIKLSEVKNNLMRNSEIGPNGERYLKIIASKTLPTSIEQKSYVGEVEVLGYSNEKGRRMQEGTTAIKSEFSIKKFLSVFAGNKNENDHNKAEKITIIPPTGTKDNIEIKYIIYALLGVFVIILVKVLTKKLKKIRK